MKILLDEKEIKNAVQDLHNNLFPHLADNLQDWQAVAKAQLKKVVEWQVANDVLCSEKEAPSCSVCKNFYEALLKEVEDEPLVEE